MAAGGFTRTDNPFPLDDDVSFTVISKLKCASAMPRDDSERDILLQRAAILALIELYHSNPYGDGFKELFQAAGWELFLRYRELRHVPVEGVSTFIYRTTRCPAGLDRSLVNDFYYSTERSCRLDVMGQCYTIWYQTDMHFYADVDPRLRDKYFTLYGEKTRTALRPIDVFKTVFSQLADAAAKLPGRRDEDMAKLLETYENKFPYLYM